MVENKDMEELKEGWRKDKLENLTNYIARGIPPKYSENLNDIIVINQKCIRDGKLSLKDSRYHNYSLKKVAEEKILKKYDILINSTGVGTLGRVCQNLLDNENLTVDTHVTIVRPNLEKINPIYLGFAIRNNQKFIESLGEGSTGQTELKRQRLADEVEIFYPEDIETQEKIASILSALDDKIEINNEMNKTLEEMAQTLFKRWFIDFDFPNENGEPYKSSGGKMVDSELGEIPEGWEVEKVENIIEVKDGTHDSPKKSGAGYKLVTSKHLEKNKINFESANVISEEDYIKINKRSQVNQYDILISMIGTIGNLYLVMEEKINYVIKNIGLFKTSQNKEYYSYIYFYLKTELIENYIKSRLAGSTQQYISLGELRKIPIMIPNNEILNKFRKISEKPLEKIYFNVQEIQSLTEIRDTLLPKLMSGEIEV